MTSFEAQWGGCNPQPPPPRGYARICQISFKTGFSGLGEGLGFHPCLQL